MEWIWLAIAALCGLPSVDGVYVGPAGELVIAGKAELAVLTQGNCQVTGLLLPECDRYRLEVVETDGDCAELRSLQMDDTCGFLVPTQTVRDETGWLQFAPTVRFDAVAPGCRGFVGEMTWRGKDAGEM